MKRYPTTNGGTVATPGTCKCGAKTYDQHLKQGHGHTYSGS